MSGFVIYHAKRDSFLNWKIYFSRESAEAALERVVWHNREGWVIHPMPAIETTTLVSVLRSSSEGK